ncbi:MAG: efflux RND transporter periplasmic adaptor subunit [Tenacibaculum sp.]
MKKHILTIIIILLLVGCNTKKENNSEQDHAQEHDKTEKSTKNATDKHEDDKHENDEHENDEHEDDEHEDDEHEDDEHENEIHLTKAQILAADIQTAVLEKKSLRNRIAVTGTIEAPPQNKATLYAPLEAFVHHTELLSGDKVFKGQTVAILQHPNFIKLQYSYLEAVNNRNVAKADYERKKILFEEDIVSKKSFQASQATFKSLQSLVKSYASQLKMVGLLPSQVSEKGIQQYVHIKSPITGYVVQNSLNKGKFLSANSEMMEIIDNKHIHAELKVFGTDVSKIKKGDEFVFKPSGINKEYSGYIKLISQKVNDISKTVDMHGHFEDSEGLLNPGMFINAEILLKANEKMFALPEEAIIENEGKNFIFVAKTAEEFMPLEITTGISDKGLVEIKSIENNNFNLTAVIKGAHFLKGKMLQMGGEMEGHAH